MEVQIAEALLADMGSKGTAVPQHTYGGTGGGGGTAPTYS
jgi:hypothetical protein